MIPKPPFLKDLTPEREAAEFEALKPRLAEVWDALMMRDEVPHTTVVVPSLTLDQSELTKIAGVNFYEERLLFLLIRLRNPPARIIGITVTTNSRNGELRLQGSVAPRPGLLRASSPRRRAVAHRPHA